MSECITDSKLRVYDASGDCAGNTCEYGYTDNDCTDGCVDGECKGCVPNCEGKQCGDNGCGGSCGVCNQPAAPECITPVTLRTYNSTGDCTTGICSYGHTDTQCEFGCADGACTGCVVNCEGKECGSDGCGGNCGSCNQPPAPECISGDPDVLRVYNISGACDAGNCNYGFTDIDCEFECAEGQCQQCAPNCEERQCGPDGCGGFCGICNVPPASECVSDTTILVYEATGDCNDVTGLCAYESNVVPCEFGCTDGLCNNCTAACEGKECGPDGCGGNCAEGCELQVEACSVEGTCLCVYDPCEALCCPQGDVCTGGACCTPAGECPEAVECGGWTDSCGVAHVCDPCLNGYSCVDNSCECLSPKVECNSVCCQTGAICYNNNCCVADCAGKQCGNDGCGGSCGTCGANESCNAEGQCICAGVECNGVCCAAGAVCHNDACCTPACTGKECGSDSCGGICGICGDNETCAPDSQCVCADVECDGACCEIGEVCHEDACCMPDCDGKDCGPDGCGGSCGACDANATCTVEGLCDCDFEACVDACCTDGQVCFEDACCTPTACGAKECGTDGCGTSCGTCEANETCSVAGVCECPNVVCNAACCAAGQVCHSDACCTPDCTGKECGPDGCGGTCAPGCELPDVCNDTTGQCE
ncbi:MAG: hypothetical protein C4523_07500 [Myxococcales bacterium]|nr:MAG: hypothetical protein C4523_07500 [Myxococcales bacterium]